MQFRLLTLAMRVRFHYTSHLPCCVINNSIGSTDLLTVFNTPQRLKMILNLTRHLHGGTSLFVRMKHIHEGQTSLSLESCPLWGICHSRSACHGRGPIPTHTVSCTNSWGNWEELCLWVCPKITTSNEEMHRLARTQDRAEVRAAEKHLQLQPQEPGAPTPLPGPGLSCLCIFWFSWHWECCFYATRGCWHCGTATGTQQKSERCREK